MSTEASQHGDYDALLATLGVSLDRDLLELALTHRSYAHENGGIPTNERLEFLGDSVLSIAVTEELYRSNPTRPEGDLAKMRAATVSQKALASVAREHSIGEFVKLGKGENVTGGRQKDSILSDTVEALIGAVYLTHGLEESRAMILRFVGGLLADARDLSAALDWKTSLQEIAGKAKLPVPSYEVEGFGPDHERSFEAVAIVGTFHGKGKGTSKKAAENQAAEDAYALISTTLRN